MLAKKVLVTGAEGFLGRNLCSFLEGTGVVELNQYDLGSSPSDLHEALSQAGVIFHLAGVNRPENVEDFAVVNAGVTANVCRALEGLGRSPKVILASSIQAEQDNPYGRSKRQAEEELRRYCSRTPGEGVAYRLKNLFGKWCKPNYNSVTATFCHNIARDLPIEISDPARELELTYVDDVVASFVSELERPPQAGFRFGPDLPSYRIRLGDLAETIRSFRGHRSTLRLPDYSNPLVRTLYATYLSYLEPEQCAYRLDSRADPRGSLAEFLKSPNAGQLFVSRTKPGITRGNHYHNTKAEKFLVVQGEAVIRLRPIGGEQVTEHHVRGEDYVVVDIPPGTTHSIENVGDGDVVTLFWSNEIFEPTRPDTIAATVVSQVDEREEK